MKRLFLVTLFLFVLPAHLFAPLVTGVWESFEQFDYNQWNHFTGTKLVIDPFTKISTGKTARQIINEQVAVFGLPLVGMYISASGDIPHLVLHRSQFPAQTGPANLRAEKLQTALQTALDNVYKAQVFIDDPTDPDFGQTIDVRNFWVNVHVWNYRNDGLYTPRRPGSGDFAIYVSDSTPPGNWWQERN
jgi:hypothetical protein